MSDTNEAKYPSIDATQYPSWCMQCCIRFHPQMLTGYCLRSMRCDQCGHTSDLAIVKMQNDVPVTREEHFERLNAWKETEEWKNSRFDFETLVGQRWEITRELYDYFLEILPPVRWRSVGTGEESFFMSEALSGDIRSKYSRENGRYFHEWSRIPKGTYRG